MEKSRGLVPVLREGRMSSHFLYYTVAPFGLMLAIVFSARAGGRLAPSIWFVAGLLIALGAYRRGLGSDAYAVLVETLTAGVCAAILHVRARKKTGEA